MRVVHNNPYRYFEESSKSADSLGIEHERVIVDAMDGNNVERNRILIPKRVLDNWEALGKSLQLPYYFRKAKFFKVIETLGIQRIEKDFYWDAGYGDLGVVLLDLYPLFSSVDDILAFEKRMNVWIARVLPDEALEVLFLSEGTNSEKIEKFLIWVEEKRKAGSI